MMPLKRKVAEQALETAYKKVKLVTKSIDHVERTVTRASLRKRRADPASELVSEPPSKKTKLESASKQVHQIKASSTSPSKRTTSKPLASKRKRKWEKPPPAPSVFSSMTLRSNLKPSKPTQINSKQQLRRKPSTDSVCSQEPQNAQSVAPSSAGSPARNMTTKADTQPLKTTEQVSKFWYQKCKEVFSLEAGYEIDIYGDKASAVQRVVVWDQELHDPALAARTGKALKRPNVKILPDVQTYCEAELDLSNDVISPPATLTDYLNLKTKKKPRVRDVAVLVIECRAADADSNSQWREPLPTDLCRSVREYPPAKSDIQATLIKYCDILDTVVGYSSKAGYMTQEQCFCATAIGDRVMFWKHLSPFPHLKKWSPVLNRSRNPEQFKRMVDKKFTKVEEYGFMFAMEMGGRMRWED